MNEFEIEKLYEDRGLIDCRLRTTGDLQNIHHLNYKLVVGYDTLDDLHKKVYQDFLMNFFNGLGLKTRETIFLKGIHYVEEVEYMVLEPDEEYPTVIGNRATAINKYGDRTIIHDRLNTKGYEGFTIRESKPVHYLKFEYSCNGRKSWLHVVEEGKEWY